MPWSEDIQPIAAGTLSAAMFGTRAARLSAMASADLPVAPGVALSHRLMAQVARDGAEAIAPVLTQVANVFPRDLFLTMRASPQERGWGGPAAIDLIGASRGRLGALKGPQDLVRFIADFAGAVHAVDKSAFAANGDDPITAALVAYEAQTGEAFPERTTEQLSALLVAYARAWNSPTARILRQTRNAPEDAGLGVLLLGQAPHAETGWAQGIDSATGSLAFVDTGGALSESAAARVAEHVHMATRLLGDAAAVEYSVRDDKVALLYAAPARRSSKAELQTVVDLVAQGVLNRDRALLRVDPRSLIEHIHPQIADSIERDVAGHGIAASPGAAQGPIAFSADAAQAADAQGRRAILVRSETSPEDIRGMHSAAGVLTLTGGLTSHAAVIAQGIGVPCVVGASRLKINEAKRTLVTADGRMLKEGDVVTLDASSGTVLMGAHTLQHSALSEAFQVLMGWADETRKIGVRANADTAQEARTARRFLADGIGLCRTEHMFYDDDRLIVMREMIIADDEATRRAALERLLPMQRGDFEALFEIMEGAPVTIRLLDPPLHEFLPKQAEGIAELAAAMALPCRVVEARIHALEEFNPMLGKRGVRLGVTFPEIYEMQARAIFEASVAASGKLGAQVVPEIMIPLVSAHREVEMIRASVEAVADDVRRETGADLSYKLGVMVETPRAALRAGDLAQSSSFLSFGTNDLTQMTYGLSRDDAGRFMRDYVNAGVYPEDPFLTLDVEAVGELLLTATQRGRKANGDIVLGLCGEHGGDPASVRFCKIAGFDYVSCSPFRVPIARLAAAQATLLSGDAGSDGAT